MLSDLLSVIPVVIAIIAGIICGNALIKNDPLECDPEECKYCPFPCDKANRKE